MKKEQNREPRIISHLAVQYTEWPNTEGAIWNKGGKCGIKNSNCILISPPNITYK